MQRTSYRQPLTLIIVVALSAISLFTLLSRFNFRDSFATSSNQLINTHDSTHTLSSHQLDRSSSEASIPASLLYRQHLKLTTSPPSQLIHSPTLTFSHIYVLSLPTRVDRRALMTKVARALGLEIIFVDAVDKERPFIRWIAERVHEIRLRKVELIAKERQMAPHKIGGLGILNIWLSPTADKHGQVPFPSLTDEHRYPEGTWLDHLEAAAAHGRLDSLLPSESMLNVSKLLWDPVETISARQVNEGVISTFWGHTRAMKLAIDRGDESALILEDDVDIEWDIQNLWSRIEAKLPADWETCLIGHCWGKEYRRPAYLHPHLHQSTAPLCLHAYALSAGGLRRVYDLLMNPWSAYGTAIDTAFPTYIAANLVKSFSLEPPLIIQRKNGPSDIQPGIGSDWRGYLADSTIERIWRDEGIDFVEDVYDEEHLDPAAVFHGGRVCRNCPTFP